MVNRRLEAPGNRSNVSAIRATAPAEGPYSNACEAYDSDSNGVIDLAGAAVFLTAFRGP